MRVVVFATQTVDGVVYRSEPHITNFSKETVKYVSSLSNAVAYTVSWTGDAVLEVYTAVSFFGNALPSLYHKADCANGIAAFPSTDDHLLPLPPTLPVPLAVADASYASYVLNTPGVRLDNAGLAVRRVRPLTGPFIEIQRGTDAANSVVGSDTNKCSVIVGGGNTLQIGSDSAGGYTLIVGSGNIVREGGCAFGTNNVVTNSASVAFGTDHAIAADNTIAVGKSTKSSASVPSAVLHASGRFAHPGDAQYTRAVCYRSTGNATPALLFCFSVGFEQMVYVSAQIAAYNTTDNTTAAYALRFAVKRADSGNAALVGTPVKEVWEEAGMSACDVGVVVFGGAEVCLSLTGLASKTIKWVATCHMTRVADVAP
jgi:hypothetical protein